MTWGKNGSVSGCQRQSPRHSRELAGSSSTDTGSATSPQENPLWKSSVPRSCQPCQGRSCHCPGRGDRTVAGVHHTLGCETKTWLHPKASSSFICSVIQQLPRKTRSMTSSPDCPSHSLISTGTPQTLHLTALQVQHSSVLTALGTLRGGWGCPTRRGKHTLSI